MTNPLLSRVLAALLLTAAITTVTAQTAMDRYKGLPTNTTVSIQGTSTAHDWEMKGTLIGGYFEVPAGVSFDPAQATIPGLKDGALSATVVARIFLNSIHSQADHMPGVMDDLMLKAMKAPDFPRIEYHLTELKLKDGHTAGKPFEFDAKGDLAIAGVTNKVSFPVTITYVDKQTIKISAKTKLKMTDYKVEPPAPNFGLGLMKCADEVTIIIEWTVAKPAK
jgi:polyisoprenoid-binding protein YceI